MQILCEREQIIRCCGYGSCGVKRENDDKTKFCFVKLSSEMSATHANPRERRKMTHKANQNAQVRTHTSQIRKYYKSKFAIQNASNILPWRVEKRIHRAAGLSSPERKVSGPSLSRYPRIPRPETATVLIQRSHFARCNAAHPRCRYPIDIRSANRNGCGHLFFDQEFTRTRQRRQMTRHSHCI